MVARLRYVNRGKPWQSVPFGAHPALEFHTVLTAWVSEYSDKRSTIRPMGASGQPERLPSFRDPPLEEVALAVQLQPNAVDLLGMAEFASAVRHDFPQRQDQIGRPPIMETFEVPIGAPPFQFELLQGAPPQRLWLLSDDHTGLLQVQQDIIVYNWRRSPEGEPVGDPYPRYSRLRDEFSERYLQFERIASDHGQDLRPNWCEVTYINHIGGEAGRPEMRELLRGIEPSPAGAFLPPIEDGLLNLRYTIPGDEAPRGRLTVSVAPAVRRADLAPIWVMTLTARTLAADESQDAAFEALDVGHEWVVKGFAELTSERMHELWGEEISNATAG